VRSSVAQVTLPTDSRPGVPLGRSLTVPLKPNQMPPASSSAAFNATARPPWLTLPRAIGPTRLDTTMSRRVALTAVARAGSAGDGGDLRGLSRIAKPVSHAVNFPPPPAASDLWLRT